MLEDKDRIFTNLYGYQDWGIEGAMKRGDWDNTKALLDIGQAEIIERIKASGLRGRGGAGFPTGLKWSLLPKAPQPGPPSFPAINTDQSNTGSSNDREITPPTQPNLIPAPPIAAYP